MKVKYTIKETFKNLWRNRLMGLASITSVAATLMILGIIFALVVNINNFSQGAKEQFNVIAVYLDDQVEGEQIEKIKTQIKDFKGVKNVRFKSKNKALNEYKNSWGDNAYLLEGLEDNPLPNTLEISLDKIEYSDIIVNQVNKFNGIEEIKYDKDTIGKLIHISNYIKNIGMILILILVGISTFIISNTIKLAMNARKKEINIMKYVGATSWFIRWPFILEGTILGLIGALLSSGLMYYIYQYTFSIYNNSFFALIAAYLERPQAIFSDIFVLFITIGCGIGALGSLTSIRKYLEV
ncbi:MAG: permease-like cell division protein FtsX [Bacillota bacterium]